MIIAVDGPAGSGKSTISKLIAEKLNLLYIDTGAMYRAVTFMWLQTQLLAKPYLEEKLITDNDVRKAIKKEILYKHHEKALQIICDNIKIRLETSDLGLKTFLNDIDISEYIRTTLVTQNVSHIASYKEVRTFLVDEQRRISQGTDVILDGRDIGTVVFPFADYKFFLTASIEVRAKRRLEDMKKIGEEISLEELCADLKRRDHLDSTREEAPLLKAHDAIEINTDNFSIEEVKNQILKKLLKFSP
jgi:cytidylate kinase